VSWFRLSAIQFSRWRSRSREAISSFKDDEAILLRQRSHFLGPRKRPETEIRSNHPLSNDQPMGGFDHVEHSHRPNLLLHNCARSEVNPQRCGQDPEHGVPIGICGGPHRAATAACGKIGANATR
jgi:hypothetical protein